MIRILTVAALLICTTAMAGTGGEWKRESACNVRELRFFNGFSLSLPPDLCVARRSGPDYWIYEFASGPEAAPFLSAYVGYAANFPEGVCGKLAMRESPRSDVTQYGGSIALDGKRCGETLVSLPPNAEGAISSKALHFWYTGITEEQEKVVQRIIGSVKPAAGLPDDPPLKAE